MLSLFLYKKRDLKMADSFHFSIDIISRGKVQSQVKCTDPQKLDQK